MLRELRARLNLFLGNRISWRRGNYVEKPARELTGLTREQRQRIAALKAEFDVNFEGIFDRSNSLENYLYLDLLNQLRSAAAEAWPQGGRVIDAGSKNFYYAPVLHAALVPDQLIGIEIEGYRLYRNFYSRYDYAMAYINALPDTAFIVGDFCDYQDQADVITCLYPFVFEDTHINWRLPASRFNPDAYFDAVARNLKPGAKLIMVNQGEAEAAQAAQLCRSRELEQIISLVDTQPLLQRNENPICSLWHKPIGTSAI